MKKSFNIHIFLISVFLCLLLPYFIYADGTLSIDIICGDEFGFGSLVIGTSEMVERTIIQNKGTIHIDLGLVVSMNSAGWKAVSHKPGSEEFRLSGLFHQWDKPVCLEDFQEDDAILGDMKISSTNVFAISEENNNKKAYNMEPEKEVNLFYRFDAPSFTKTTNTQVTLKIIIKAVAYTPPFEEVIKPTQVLITPNGDGVNDILRFPGLIENFEIKILDTTGRVIKIISDKNEWNGTDESSKVVPSGVYMYQYEYTKKFICGLVVIVK